MVLVFANEVNPALTGLVKKLDAFVKENKKANAKAVIVFLGKNGDEQRKQLKALAKEHKLDVPLTINVDGETSKKFSLNKDVKHTVLLYLKKKVTANFALNDITKKDVEAVLKAAKEQLKAS